jgi:hypothetical protein
MIFGENFVFLELQKTGSTYARYVLKRTPHSFEVGKKHNIFDHLNRNEQIFFKSAVKVGSIRNPFEFYVSLYGFSCSRRGGLYTFATKRPDVLNIHKPLNIFKLTANFIKFHSRWLKVLSDVNSIDNFKEFLSLILYENPTVTGAHFGLSNSHNYLGYLSHNYLRTFSYDFIRKVRDYGEYIDFLNHDSQNNFIDVMLRNESMKHDLLDNSERIGIDKKFMLNAIVSRPTRSNTSSKHLAYQDYYDQESIQWVMDREKLLLDKYNYRFD